MNKGDKVLVKDSYNRVWTEATFVVEWNGFYYTEAVGGRNLNRWDECKPCEDEVRVECDGDSCVIKYDE